MTEIQTLIKQIAVRAWTRAYHADELVEEFAPVFETVLARTTASPPLTASDLMALTDLVAEHLRCPGATEVYVDVTGHIETTPTALLARLIGLAPAARPSPRLRLRYQTSEGHVSCRVFTQHGAVGDLIFGIEEWPTVVATLRRVMDLMPEDRA